MKTTRKEDRITGALKELFDHNGYKYYKMRKFEEYSLYMENKNFLSDDRIITFNHNGKLLALKPDVTLSIVKNAKANVGQTEKLYYKESVYRYDRKSEEYKEINQIGLEVIGNIDLTKDCEILSLAMKSLDIISEKNMLCISNTGIISGLFSHFKIESHDAKENIICCIKGKNKHELTKYLREIDINEEGQKMFVGLLDGEIPCIDEIEDAANLLKKTVDCMNELGYSHKIKVDFSIINDPYYYNGIVFNGFISGIPKVVLSGGRYDGLVEKFGAKVNAEGFAVYLDDLLYLDECVNYDADVILIYNENDEPSKVLKRAKEITDSGESVRLDTEVPAGFKFRRKEIL